MTQPHLEHIGPLERLQTLDAPRAKRRLPIGFLIVVVLPTIVAAIYFLLIAAPQYVSEARFVVRAPTQEKSSPFDMALQGVGISSSQTDEFVVHEYILSRDGLRNLEGRGNLRGALSHPALDFWARFPRPFESRDEESLYRAYGRFVTVGYDSTRGISTLRVKAFRAEDAQRMATLLLDGGERVVNDLNGRAYRDAVADANRSVIESEARLNEAQARLTAFRTQERIVDPARVAQEGAALIGELMGQAALLRAERAQLVAISPQSPQLPMLASRIAALEEQIGSERSSLAGAAGALAPKIGVYEELMLNRELADRSLTQARVSQEAALNQARSQRLYLQRVVEPNLPTAATQPRRLLSILTVLISALLLYGVGMLVVSSLREHRQG